ncbi:hypothetical protein JCM1841_004644 [Sporobolomyces salmonicolor]
MSVSTRAARQTYHPGGYGVSEGLKRARAPFRTKNALVGLSIATFAFSVYFYSIRAVAQDDFSDLAAPTEEERRGARSIEDEKRAKEALRAEVLRGEAGLAKKVDEVKPVEASVPGRTSVLQMVRGAFGGRGTESKLVWGAPSVDRVGRISEDVPQPPRRLV